MSDEPQWQYDPTRGLSYYFSATENAYVFQDGTRIPLSQSYTAAGAHSTGSTGVPEGPTSASPRSESKLPTQATPYHAWASGTSSTGLQSQMQQLNLGGDYTATAGAQSNIPSQLTAEQLHPLAGYGMNNQPAPVAENVTGNEVVHENNDVINQALQQKGLPMRGRIRGSARPTEVDPEYQIRIPGHKFFKLGRVLKVLWPEPLGNPTKASSSTRGNMVVKENTYTKIRWFIVVLQEQYFSLCVPINTYNRQGVAKTGIVKSQHAIAYSTSKEPKPKDNEKPQAGEDGMMPGIRIQPRKKTDKLHLMARIDFCRVYTVEHNVKVYDFGKVDPAHTQRLRDQWIRVIQQGGAGFQAHSMPNISENAEESGDDDDDDDDEEDQEGEEEEEEEDDDEAEEEEEEEKEEPVQQIKSKARSHRRGGDNDRRHHSKHHRSSGSSSKKRR